VFVRTEKLISSRFFSSFSLRLLGMTNISRYGR